MPHCQVGTENGGPIEIYYEDHGSGQPVVLIHGYPLDGDSWERQEAALLPAGYRVVRYDRRGFGPERVSDQAWQASFNVAAGSGPHATYACVDSWLEDFRDDLPRIDVPTLVVHGTADRILPFEATAHRLPGLIADVRLVPVEGGPHAICWTHPDEVNRARLEFLGAPVAQPGTPRHTRRSATALA